MNDRKSDLLRLRKDWKNLSGSEISQKVREYFRNYLIDKKDFAEINSSNSALDLLNAPLLDNSML